MTTKSKLLKSSVGNQLSLGKQVLLGAVSTVIVQSGGLVVSRVARHPLLVFGLGVAVGCLVYRNRIPLIKASDKAVETGKKVVLDKKEKLLDLVAEVREK